MLRPAGEGVEVGELVRVDSNELVTTEDRKDEQGRGRQDRARTPAARRRDAREDGCAGEGEEGIDRQHVANSDVVGGPDRGQEEDRGRQQKEAALLREFRGPARLMPRGAGDQRWIRCVSMFWRRASKLW